MDSNTVAVFKRDGDSLRFDKVVSTRSAPVSAHDRIFSRKMERCPRG